MRLGAYILAPYRNAEEYVSLAKQRGYRAVYCPDYLRSADQTEEIRELKQALRESDIVLAEVGTWVNPLSPDPVEREAARRLIVERLALAEALEARCCVNVIGSLSPVYWYAPCAENFEETLFTQAVETYQALIDAVPLSRTKFAFEIMCYSLLDDADGYLRFLKMLERPEKTAVHLDLANLIHDPRSFYAHRALFADAIEKLGKLTASVHLKDLRLDPKALAVHILEEAPGRGELDMGYAMELLERLPEDTPVMLEHLERDEDYTAAAQHLRGLAEQRGIRL